MSDSEPSFFVRFTLAFSCLFRILFDARFAGDVLALKQGGEPAALSGPMPRASEALKGRAEIDPEAEARAEAQAQKATASGAVLMLTILQREGRLVDFVQQDISQFSDSEIGAVARVVHDGCKRSLDSHFDIEPVRTEAENAQVRVDESYEAATTKLTGNVRGTPPYVGVLRHRGWQARAVHLPRLLGEATTHVIAPAEVEL